MNPNSFDLNRAISEWRYYTTIAFRNIIRHRTTAFINIFGLSVGIACCILAIAFARYHASWDTFHENGDRIFRVLLETEDGVRDKTIGPLAPAMEEAFPEVEAAVRIRRVPAWALPPDGKFSTRMAVTDPSILEVFDYQLISGDPKTALRDPFSVVLTESAALKWFGTTDIVGRTLPIESYLLNGDYEVTGVTQDLPSNATVWLRGFDIISTTRIGLGSANYGGRQADERWNSWTRGGRFTTFVMLRSPELADSVVRKIPKLVATQMGDEIASRFRHRLQPLGRMHLVVED